MLGGHLDSWHAATGATDNAIGCAVTMEAVRILSAIGVRPRRTIRLALWSGEEQGLFGSQAYVREHFGTFEEPKPAYSKFAGYVNIDSGTGLVRPCPCSVPPPRARSSPRRSPRCAILACSARRRRTAAPAAAAITRHSMRPACRESTSIQDPIEYDTHSWHSNLDTYERIVEEDVKKAAIVIASAVYHLAMRDEQLPRFTKETMPRRQPTPPQQPAAK